MSSTPAGAAFAIAATIFNGLWEGPLIAGVVWLGLRGLPKLGAATCYAIWLFALAALVLIPPLTVRLSVQPSEPIVEAALTSGQRSMPVAPVEHQRLDIVRAVPEPSRATTESATVAASPPRITISQSLALAIALVWVLVAATRGLLLLLDLRALAAIRRDARLWSTARGYPVFLSDRVQVPLAAGFRHPAIILPAALVEQMPADAVETIVIHELAHLRRYDVWTNALARIAEALAILNPAAWFVMRRLSMEREIACDDWVVARTGSGDAFAQTLAMMAGAIAGRVPLAAPSAIGSRHAIVERIERLLDARPRRLRLSPSALGCALAVLALIALAVQSISPVLAYASDTDPSARLPAPAQLAAACAVPNRQVRMATFLGMNRRWPGFSQDGLELPDPSRLTAQFGATNVATFELAVDATGRPLKVSNMSAPRYPGMAEHVTRILMGDTYVPALHDCVPVATTIRSALHVGTPLANVYSIVVPAYPEGWSAKNPAACKVPTVQHTGVPAFPDSMQDVPVDARYGGSVRVHVDPAGAVTNAAIVTSSGHKAFDDALLTAARQARYPLADSTGFKQARPSGTAPSWNAAHGSDTYVNCKPAPADYVWNTTFGHIVPIGPPGTTFLIQGPR
jgi:TonB family protein